LGFAAEISTWITPALLLCFAIYLPTVNTFHADMLLASQLANKPVIKFVPKI